MLGEIRVGSSDDSDRPDGRCCLAQSRSDREHILLRAVPEDGSDLPQISVFDCRDWAALPPPCACPGHWLRQETKLHTFLSTASAEKAAHAAAAAGKRALGICDHLSLNNTNLLQPENLVEDLVCVLTPATSFQVLSPSANAFRRADCCM